MPRSQRVLQAACNRFYEMENENTVDRNSWNSTRGQCAKRKTVLFVSSKLLFGRSSIHDFTRYENHAISGSAPERTPAPVIMTFFEGVPLDEPTASTLRTTSIEASSRTSPKTTCLLSSHAVFAVVMKNWLPLVFGPAFAIDNCPGFVCFTWKFSSLNLAP